MKKSSLSSIAAAGVSCALIAACAGGAGDANSPLRAPSSASRVLTTAAVGDAGNEVVNQGEVEVCKRGAGGNFYVVVGTAAAVPYNLAKDECKVVAVNLSQTTNQNVTVTELSGSSYALDGIVRKDLAFIVGTPNDGPIQTSTPSNPVAIIVNGFHGTLLEFTNHAITPPPPPPPSVCDFVTFGRLVTSVNGQKVVISGNIGGNQPGGGFLNEFHVEANGEDNHVADITTYGPITSGPLSTLENSRMATGTAKNGVAVEIRVWDGGEPGKSTDIVYIKLGGVELLGPDGQLIDQGNMQYHANCRGPKS
jgi:hypothetical protein